MRQVLRISVATIAVLGVAALLARKAGERGSLRPDVATARPIRVLPPDSVITGPVEKEERVGGYLLRLLRDTAMGDRIVDVLQHGHRVYAVRAVDVRIDSAGKDLTGDRIPDAIIVQFTGGIHCCTQATVLSLGPIFAIHGTINGADGDVDFDDLDGDGIAEVKINDFRFAYWREYAFVETQAPEVILRFRDGDYRPACDLMREDPPEDSTLRRRARDLTDGWTAGDPPAEFWGFAVDLIYSGHPDLAWRWLENSWPAAIDGKAEFLVDLREKLRGSPCWSPAPEGQPVG